MSSSITDRTYALQEVRGKDKGLVATQKISKGTRILSEEPIVRVLEVVLDRQTLPASIHRQVDTLTPDQRRAFLSLHNIYTDDAASQYLGIIRTNALLFGEDRREGGIFLDACRTNHACDNNTQKSWNKNIKRHTVHALRDIEKGEEITIYYLGVLNSRNSRQEALRRKFAFICSCPLCSLPPDQSQESDRRLDEILKLDGLISRDGLTGIVSTPLQILRYVDQQIRLYNEQGPDDAGLPRAFFDAA
jgi:SET domain-containing protein